MTFFRNVLGTFVTEILIVVFNFAVGVLAARLLSPSDRGVMALILLLPVTLAYFADIGVSQSIIYQLGRKLRPLSVVAGNALTLGLLLGGAAVLVAWLGRGLLERTILHDTPVEYYGLVLALLPLLLIDTYLLSILRGQQRFLLFNLRRLVTPFILLVGVILLVGMAGWGVRGAVIAFVISTLLSLALALLLVSRFTPLRLGLDRQTAGEAMSFGVKSYAQNLVGHLHYRLDVYLLALFLPPAQVAFYTVATSVAEVAFYVPDSVGTVLFPKLSAETEGRIHSLTAEVIRHTLLVTSLACVGILVLGVGLIPLFYGAEYRVAVAPFVVLLPGILAMAVYKVLTRNYSSRNRQQVSVLTAVLALGLNVGLNLFFIPRMGILGAALASMLSYTLSAGVLLVFFSRETGVPLRRLLLFERADLRRYAEVWKRLQDNLTGFQNLSGLRRGAIRGKLKL